MTIGAARERVNAATPGPWVADEDEVWFDTADDSHVVSFVRGLHCDADEDEVWFDTADDSHVVSFVRGLHCDADAEFIARARTEYPLALDVVEAVARSLPAKHQAHYAYCGCLDDSSECCSPVCECHVLAAFEAATE